MPFQIQNVAAYRELVLNELRRQARTPDTDTNRIIRDYTSYWPNSGEPKYDWAIWKKIEGAHGCYNSVSEVLWYSYCYAPLHFDVLQTMMQIEENDVADVEYGDTFNRKVFNTKGDLLVIDVGCGPMTSGLALADWFVSAKHTPFQLSYVGIDNSEHCLDLAKRFAARNELFAMQSEPLFYADCGDCDIEQMKARITSNGTLLFIFSYILGQNTCTQEHLEGWATFIRQVMTASNAKHNLFLYTNSPWADRERRVDTNVKYSQFKQLLGWKHQPKEGYYNQRLLKRFNDPAGLVIMEEGLRPFRHLFVEATLVDKNHVPIREDKRHR